MDAGRIKQCPINLLLTRLKRADQRIQKTADPASDRGLCKGTSVHTSISSIYGLHYFYMRENGFGLGKFITYGGGMFGTY